VLAKQSQESFKVRFQSQFARRQVVAAARNLPIGTVLTMNDIGNANVFAQSITGRAVLPDDYTELIGKKTRSFINEGQPILWSDVDMPYGGFGGMAGMIRLNERAVSIPVDNTAAVGGHVKPNDHVDIIGTFSFPGAAGHGGATAAQQISDTVTITILQDVTILATGQLMSRRPSEMEGVNDRFGSQYSSVTVAVTPREAEMLVFSQQKGKLSLALRNREDVSAEQQLDNVDFQMLEKNFNELNRLRQQRLHPTLLPPSAPAPAAPATPAPVTPAPRTGAPSTLGR
jgi:Flp pilus assembly protein CpaB